MNMPAKAVRADLAGAMASLEAKRTTRDFENLTRFGITAETALGVSMANIQAIAGRLGRSHDLALALWETGVYEARLLSSFVDDPTLVTPAQMDRWCRDFDNWGICDTVCFHLFDRTPHAWGRVARWSRSREEFVKRAAFALLASLALHDKSAPDARFVEGLALVERCAADDRHLVKKGVSWALRLIGRRNAALNARAVAVARRLATSTEPAPRSIGKEALRELTGAVVVRHLARQAGRSPKKGKATKKV
jgi:3-methyladenine DNA glycosylase AlkD